MGFTVPKREALARPSKALEASEMLITFDSGYGISLHEATPNSIARSARVRDCNVNEEIRSHEGGFKSRSTSRHG